MSQLTYLNVGRNRLVGENMQLISGLVKLKYLNVNNCGVGDEGCQVISLLPQLETLDISSNHFSSDGLQYLSNCKLKSLNISCWRDSYYSRGLESKSLELLLVPMKTLETLIVNHSEIVKDGISIICSLENLKSLQVRYNFTNYTNKDIRIDLELIGKMKNLTSLDLSDSQIVGETDCLSLLQELTCLHLYNVKILSYEFLTNLNKIQTLNVGANGLGSQVDTIKLITSMKNITSLSIGSNDLKSEQFSLIGCMSNLTFLEIDGNNLNSDSIIPITHLRKLRHLCVESNSLGTEGVKHLTSLQALTYLDIGRNNIDQEGVYHLSLLPSLTHLDINTNKIGDEGAQYICTNMSQLKWLDISENHLTVTGVRKILKMKNRWLYLGI